MQHVGPSMQHVGSTSTVHHMLQQQAKNMRPAEHSTPAFQRFPFAPPQPPQQMKQQPRGVFDMFGMSPEMQRSKERAIECAYNAHSCSVGWQSTTPVKLEGVAAFPQQQQQQSQFQPKISSWDDPAYSLQTLNTYGNNSGASYQINTHVPTTPSPGIVRPKPLYPVSPSSFLTSPSSVLTSPSSFLTSTSSSAPNTALPNLTPRPTTPQTSSTTAAAADLPVAFQSVPPSPIVIASPEPPSQLYMPPSPILMAEPPSHLYMPSPQVVRASGPNPPSQPYMSSSRVVRGSPEPPYNDIRAMPNLSATTPMPSLRPMHRNLPKSRASPSTLPTLTLTKKRPKIQKARKPSIAKDPPKRPSLATLSSLSTTPAAGHYSGTVAPEEELLASDIEISEQIVEVVISEPDTEKEKEEKQFYTDFVKYFSSYRCKLGYDLEDVSRQICERYGEQVSVHGIKNFENLMLSMKSPLVRILDRWMKDSVIACSDQNTSHVVTLPTTEDIDPEQARKNVIITLPTTDIDPQRARKRKASSVTLKLEEEFNRNRSPTRARIKNIASSVGAEIDYVRGWFCKQRRIEKVRARVTNENSPIWSENPITKEGASIPSTRYDITVQVASKLPRDIGAPVYTSGVHPVDFK